MPPSLPARYAFLQQCRPGSKLLAFASLSAAIMGISPHRLAWWWAVLVVVLAMMAAGISWSRWWALLRRLQILFLTLILFHGFFVPGHWIWQALPSLTQEGVLEGVRQSLRLIFLASLAWTLSATSTPMQLVAIGAFPRLCQQWPSWRRGLALLAMTLHLTGRLLHGAEQIKQSLYLRQVGQGVTAWARAGKALLGTMFQHIPTLEEALLLRGFEQLPLFMPPAMEGAWWRDGVVVGLAFVTWIWLIIP